MTEVLQSVDAWVFLRLNADVANVAFDWFMPIITNIRHFRIPLIVILAALALFGGGKGRSAVILALVLLTTTDQLASHVLKPWIERLRPCHVVEGARAITGCGNTFSFPSGHATSTMAAAIWFGVLYRRWLWPAVILSALVSYSRIYLGIHYPFDILGGWIIGGGLACGLLWLYKSILRERMERVWLFQLKSTPQ